SWCSCSWRCSSGSGSGWSKPSIGARADPARTRPRRRGRRARGGRIVDCHRDAVRQIGATKGLFREGLQNGPTRGADLVLCRGRVEVEKHSDVAAHRHLPALKLDRHAPNVRLMAVQLNHTIIWCRDNARSARFLTEILGLPEPAAFFHFLVVPLENGISLDFA